MAHVVGEPIAHPWKPRDVAGALITGKVNADFTKAAYLPDPANPGAVLATAAVTVTPVTGQSGSYVATFTPPVVGKDWQLEVGLLHSDGETYAWEQDFEVVTAAQADPAGSGAAAIAAAVAAQAVAGGSVGSLGYELHALFQRPQRGGND